MELLYFIEHPPNICLSTFALAQGQSVAVRFLPHRPHGRASETCSSSVETTNQNVKIASAVDVPRCLNRRLHLTTCNCSGNRQRFPGYRFGLVFGSGKRRRQPAFGTANYDGRASLGYCRDQQAIDSVYEYQIMYYMQPFLTYCLPWHEALFWVTPASNYQIIGLPFA